MTWNTQLDRDYTPEIRDDGKTRLEMEFCSLPGLGTVASLLVNTLTAFPSPLTKRLERIRIEHDPEPPDGACRSFLGISLADKYRVTVWYSGNPEREERGRVEGGRLIPEISGAPTTDGNGIGLVPLLGLAPIIIAVAILAFVLGAFVYGVVRDGAKSALVTVALIAAVGVGGFFLVKALGKGLGERASAKILPNPSPRRRRRRLASGNNPVAGPFDFDFDFLSRKRGRSRLASGGGFDG